MRRILAAAVLLAAALLTGPEPHAQSRSAPKLLRVLVLVDSSSAVQNMLNPFRSALANLADGLPSSAEVLMVTTGGQFHLRLQPTLDHEKFRKEARGFTSDGAANTLLETMIEADERFLRKGTDRRPVIVIMTTDSRQAREEWHLDAYNKFMKDFVARNGRAHGIVIRGGVNGAITSIVMNLAQNTEGFYDSIAIDTALPDKIKQLAAVLSADSL